jgi:CheY-like chemotaxis protein
MESVGRLAGGVAHDFNNLLTVINGHVSMLLQELGPDNSWQESLEAVQTAGEKATHLTRQLLAFSRKQVLMPRVINLNDLIRENTRMLRRLIEENIELQLFLGAELKNVKADSGQMEQVLMNLAVNARDAMPEGGKLTLETRNLVLTEEYCRTHAVVVPGPYVLLAVSDTGRGIESRIQPHIFEPFFTTKEKGKGTGLGLSMVYGIIKQSGGYIWVYSEPNQGSTFKIYLPVSEDAGEALPEPPEEPELAMETKTVLVVEDDEMVRSLTCLGLRKYGFTVIEAVDTREALIQGAEFPGKIDLLLTDVVMPQMSGHQLAEKIEPLRPGIQVLYMSGYTDNAIVHHGVLDPGLAFLQKPFSPKMLARKIRSLLRKSP